MKKLIVILITLLLVITIYRMDSINGDFLFFVFLAILFMIFNLNIKRADYTRDAIKHYSEQGRQKAKKEGYDVQIKVLKSQVEKQRQSLNTYDRLIIKSQTKDSVIWKGYIH